MKWVAYGHNPSYNFIPYLLKLKKCFCHGLKMLIGFWVYPSIVLFMFFIFFIFTFSMFHFFSGLISISIDNLWVQLIVQSSTNHFKLCIVFVFYGLYMFVWFLGYPPIVYFYHFFHFFDLIFPGLISIRIEIPCARKSS